ncbi:hypothetical protein V5799_004851 [Amblyomma americanum]|uniref:Uncharacterized protein n=2 Tax=Amblyomma americanum TaxID=6943 RepID=A0AAQ4D4X5_AMBAM
MDGDSASSKWGPALSRLMDILNSLQAQVDAERRSVDIMNEMYRQFISLPNSEKKPQQDETNSGQGDLAQTLKKLEEQLENANSVLVKARQLRNGDAGNEPKSERHTTRAKNRPGEPSRKGDDCLSDKPQPVGKSTVPKQPLRPRSRSVVSARKLSTVNREQPRSTSQTRCQKQPSQRRAPSPLKKVDRINYKELLGTPEAQAQIRQFSALVDEARKCAAVEAECPERRQFLAMYDAEEDGGDGEPGRNKVSSVLLSPEFPTRNELQAEFHAYVDKKCNALEKCVAEFCATSVLPLLESTECPDLEYAAAIQTFYGIICNKGRRFPPFVVQEE